MKTWLSSLPLKRGLVLALLLLGVLINPCAAQPDWPNDEFQIKAAFLYKFAGYVEWPEGAPGPVDAPLTIGVLGADPIAEELMQIVQGRKIQSRGLAVRRLKAGDSLDDVAILFVGKGDATQLKPLRGALQARPVLVVTEEPAGLALGGMINFLPVDRNVRFEVSLDSVKKGGLRLSSRLLAVAQKVHGEGR